MTKTFKIQDVLRMLEITIEVEGTAVGLARKWGISTQYLSDVRRRRREPGPSILKGLGLYAETIYFASQR
jgi:hypothetical protein